MKMVNKRRNKLSKILNERKKYYPLIFIFAVLLIAGIYLNKGSLQKQESSGDFDISKINLFKKLVFNLPNMDKQMCETFPRIILSTLEELSGVVDASFEYNDHIVTVYYSPEVISKEDILNYESYAWVGTKFISEEDVDVSIIEEIYKNRDENNNLRMPEEHMSDIGDTEDLEVMNLQDFPSLVDANWLFRNKDNVKIIEIGPTEEYNKNHVNGAINIEIKDILTTTNGVTKQVLTKENFEILMKEKGLSNNDRIVIYSGKSLTHASRLYWTFKYHGHKNVAIVDGGKNAISKLDLTTKTTQKNLSDYSAETNEDIIVNSDYILDRLNDFEIILIDVRNKQEFDSGHIANAININWESMVNPDRILKSENELNLILKNVSRNKEIIVYCVSGTRASYAWFVLSEVLKYPNVKLFDGSMIEWEYKQLEVEVN